MHFAMINIQEINTMFYFGILYLKTSNFFLYTRNKIQVLVFAYKLPHNLTLTITLPLRSVLSSYTNLPVVLSNLKSSA